ncbi:MAG: hypothetical protein Ct9H300mP9_2530 [Candidatus Neomarinimicrobiota bacterium]|nr:MAG: hypothetical protein Ct9H300mP9_2530 [Candidatus Neomarinimicrobiota bacterium]
MAMFTFLGVYAYDAFYSSSIAKDVRVATIISFVVLGAIVFLMKDWAGFSYRSYNIHIGDCLVPIWPSMLVPNLAGKTEDHLSDQEW